MTSGPAAGGPSASDPAPDAPEFDFVVVGSGAGGGPLAANLAEAGFSVAVIEAGGDHECGYYGIPVMQAYASEDVDMVWNFFVSHYDDPDRAAQDSKWVEKEGGVLYPRGSTLGGSTAVSALVHIAPHPRDWEALEALTGDPDWGPAHMRTIFERIEDWQGVDAKPLPGDTEADRDAQASHGRSGWLRTTRANPAIAGREPRFLDIINATEATSRDLFDIPEDVSLPRDINAADTSASFQGMSFVPVAAGGGQRNGSRERLLAARAAHPDRLTIIGDALATRILVDGTRAVGVECLSGAGLYAATPSRRRSEDPSPRRFTVRARHEVIVSGGAFNTPQLLKLSGIGPKEELAEFGIDVLVDAPGVGENLHDRYEVSVVGELDGDFPIFDDSTLDLPAPGEPDDHLLREWKTERGGPYSTNGSLAAMVARTSAAEDEDWGVTLLVDSRYQEGTTGNHVYESQDVHAGVQSRRGPVGGAGAPADRAGRA